MSFGFLLCLATAQQPDRLLSFSGEVQIVLEASGNAEESNGQVQVLVSSEPTKLTTTDSAVLQEQGKTMWIDTGSGESTTSGSRSQTTVSSVSVSASRSSKPIDSTSVARTTKKPTTTTTRSQSTSTTIQTTTGNQQICACTEYIVSLLCCGKLIVS